MPDAPKSRMGRSPAFTLVELLVVIGIVAVVVGIVLSVIGPVRTEARRSAALATGRQLFAGLMAYSNDYDGGLPYFGTPGDPAAPPVYFGWTETSPLSHFAGHRRHWASLVVPHYYDSDISSDASVNAIAGVDRDTHFTYAKAPGALFPCAFLMTDTAFAAPAYWRGDEPPEDLSLVRGTRVSEIGFPSSKGVLVEMTRRVGFVGMSEEDATEDALRAVRVLAVTGDGAAAMRPFVTHPRVQDAAVERPFGCWSTYIFATREGLRGRDW